MANREALHRLIDELPEADVALAERMLRAPSSYHASASSELGAMKYKVVLDQSEEGFSVHAPGLPGCWSQGDTEAEALANIEDAIREYLAAVTDLTRGAEVREVEVPV
jgi:predicted RNase H-like HicB family nuclease